MPPCSFETRLARQYWLRKCSNFPSPRLWDACGEERIEKRKTRTGNGATAPQSMGSTHPHPLKTGASDPRVVEPTQQISGRQKKTGARSLDPVDPMRVCIGSTVHTLLVALRKKKDLLDLFFWEEERPT